MTSAKDKKEWSKCRYIDPDGNCDLEAVEWGYAYPCNHSANLCPDYKENDD